MTTHVFTIPDHTESLTIFFRVWDTSGNVFDFSDNTFKALAGATTPYVAATERTAMGGTGKSAYQASIDLALLNNTALAKRFILKAYSQAGGSPADTDAAISEGLVIDGGVIVVQAGELGEMPIVAQGEISVKSTAGTTAQVSAWLERGGKKLPIETMDAAASATVTLREHASASNLFAKALVAADITEDIFEAEQATPGFSDDRQYSMIVSIVENGNTHTSQHNRVVIG